MPLNWPIFGIFPSSPAAPYPGLYCHTNISLISWSTNEQRVLQYLSFCFINWLSPLFSTLKGSTRKPFSSPFLATYRLHGWVIRRHYSLSFTHFRKALMMHFGKPTAESTFVPLQTRGAIHQLLSIILKLRILVLLPVSTMPYVVMAKNS
jgi:hypothetical protein